jgi:hypothetical protein
MKKVKEPTEDLTDERIEEDIKERGVKYKVIRARALDGDKRFDGKLVGGRTRIAVMKKLGMDVEANTEYREYKNFEDYLVDTARESMATKDFKQRKIIWHELVNDMYREIEIRFETQEQRVKYIAKKFMISERSVYNFLDTKSKTNKYPEIRKGCEFQKGAVSKGSGIQNDDIVQVTKKEQELMPTSHVEYVQCPYCEKEFGFDTQKKKVVKAEEM